MTLLIVVIIVIRVKMVCVQAHNSDEILSIIPLKIIIKKIKNIKIIFMIFIVLWFEVWLLWFFIFCLYS
jgi:hypothetical protein